jgi:peptidyl-tRNA hydrolase, PTH1 family
MAKSEGEEVKPIRLICGLGNPGAAYEKTRHNIGFSVIDKAVNGATFKKEGKCLFLEERFAGRNLMWVKPQSYMNLSGDALLSILSKKRVKPEEVLVVVDDVALNLGKIRFREGGSHGGQNGLRNIIARMGSNFPRLRVGVGPVPPGRDLADYVLAKPGPDEWENWNEVLSRSVEALETAVLEGVSIAMNKWNGSK